MGGAREVMMRWVVWGVPALFSQRGGKLRRGTCSEKHFKRKGHSVTAKKQFAYSMGGAFDELRKKNGNTW